MFELKIPAMSCGHCVQAVTEAVKAADPAARLSFDLPAKTVRVETNAERQAVVEQLSAAGYTPD